MSVNRRLLDKVLYLLEDLKSDLHWRRPRFTWQSVLLLGLVSLASLVLAIYHLHQSLSVIGIEQGLLGKQDLLFRILSFIGLVFLALVLSPRKQVIKLGAILIGGHALVSILVTLIYRTYHLNNPEAELMARSYSPSFLLGGIMLLVLALVFGRLQINHFDDYDVGQIPAITGLVLVSLGHDNRLLSLLKPFFEKALIDQEGFWEKIALFIPLLLLGAIMAAVIVHGLSTLWQNRSGLGLAALSSVSAAVILNYYLQLGYKGDGTYYGYVIVPGAMAFQIAFFSVIFFALYVLINRYLLSTLLVALGVFALAMANAMKISMRAEPLLITDFVWMKDPDFVSSFIASGLLLRLQLGLLVLGGLYWFGRRYLIRGRVVYSLAARSMILAGLFFLSVQTLGAFRQEKNGQLTVDVPIVSRLYNELDLNWLGFTMSARYKSLAFVWSKQLAKTLIDKPEGYNQAAMETLYQKYLEEAEAINQDRKRDISDQTVIFLLSESFANPDYVPSVTLSEPAIPNILALKRQTTSGLMKTQFYGGGTANLEFQTLTGLPFANYSPSISVAYTEIVPKLSFFPSISHDFDAHNRIMIHPYGADGYNRASIYRQLDFEKFIAKSGSDHQLVEDKPLDVYTSDESVYKTILHEMDPERPQFFSVVTMQNHLPWIMPEPSHLVAHSDQLSEAENGTLAAYTRLLHYTDRATKVFMEQLAALEQEVTVVFYGDHLPGIYPHSLFEDQPEIQYQTDYFIWNNKNPNRKLDYPLLGANDFIAAVLEHTNSRVTPYQALLTKYLKEVSSRSGDLTAQEQETYQDMLLLQYDLAVGNHYLSSHQDFFDGRKTDK